MSNLPFDGRADKAEQQLLGSCLICREALPKALEAGLTEDDFFGPHHRAIFAAMGT